MSQVEEIQIRSADLVEAGRIHIRNNLAGTAWVGALLVGIWLYLIVTRPMSLEFDLLFGLLLLVLGALGILGGYALLLFVVAPISARIAYRQQKSLQRPFSFSWTESGFTTVRPPDSTSLMPWSDYRKWLEGKNLFLLYHSNRLYQLVPKRAFADEESVASFREGLRSRIAPRPGRVRSAKSI